MRGFDVVKKTNAPRYTLPEDWTGQRICLKWTGGIGDVLMAIGGCAAALKKKNCVVVAAVMPHQVELASCLVDVDEVIAGTKLNTLQSRNSFDIIIDFSFTITNSREIKRGCYYSLIGEHIKLQIAPGNFNFSRHPNPLYENEPTIFLHPGASNPNRRWQDKKWRGVAYELRDMGYRVVWIGTKCEFGFNSECITKLSDVSDDLLWQVKQIANCAAYFVGCDSAFAHVCGMLGIPGTVLFFSTSADDVIGRYKTLRGVDAFARLNVSPSRSLHTGCKVAAQCCESISINDVLSNCKIPIIERRYLERVEMTAAKFLLVVVGRTSHADNLASYLSHSYDVELVDELWENENGRAPDVILRVTPDKVSVQVGSGLTATVNAYHPENVKRAIRELLNTKHTE
tara:strand:- start:3671 stop:4867 length:1197 start_codon:yes stop_codon:yes gene_type:complete